jgi:uncharacterized protein YjaZ
LGQGKPQPLLAACNPKQPPDQWFLGGGGVPHWTAFQIGYDIARDYLARHPRSTAASLVDKPASVLLAGSQYQG